MQKLFNLFSTVAFLGVVSIAAGAGYVYVNKDSIVESIKEAAMEEVSEALPGLLSGALGGDIHSNLPTPGGDAADSISGSLPGASIPSVGF